MRDPERVEEATRLRSSGLKWREVAAAMNTTIPVVEALVADPTGERHAKRNRASYRRRHADTGQLRLPVGPS